MSVATDRRLIYRAATADLAAAELDAFGAKWARKHSSVAPAWRRAWQGVSSDIEPLDDDFQDMLDVQISDSALWPCRRAAGDFNDRRFTELLQGTSINCPIPLHCGMMLE